MSKDTISEIEILQLKALINKLTISNIDELIPLIEDHLKILQLCNKTIYNLSEANVIVQDTTSADSTIKEKQVEQNCTPSSQNNKIASIKQLKYEAAKDGSWVIDQLKRSLRGGHIRDINTAVDKIYVPEYIIRGSGMDHGDWIKATRIPSTKHEINFSYQLLKKETFPSINNNEPVRESADCVIVKKDKILDCFTIRVKPSDSDMNITIRLPAQDVLKLNIQEGDVIDYAFWSDNVQHGRISWKHDTTAIEIKPPHHHQIKEEKKVKALDNLKREVSPVFSDVSTVVVGGRNDNHQNILQTEIERRGGSFTYFSGHEKKTAFQNVIRSADAVIVFTENVSHYGMNTAKEFCNKYNVPVSFTKGLNKHLFVERVKILLKRKKKDEKSKDKAVC